MTGRKLLNPSLGVAADILVGGGWTVLLISSLPRFVERIATQSSVMAGLKIAVPASLIIFGLLIASIQAMRGREWGLMTMWSFTTILGVLMLTGVVRRELGARLALDLSLFAVTLGLVPLRVFGRLGSSPEGSVLNPTTR